MADDIRRMTAELARNPESMVFLELGEELRRRSQLHGAAKVTIAGLERHPESADAHDLYARVLVDMGHLQQAFDEWRRVVELEPRHQGAHKGLGFLCYRWGDLDGALDHLELALAADPLDASVVQALRVVRDAAMAVGEEPEDTPSEGVFEGLEGAREGLLLVDGQGRVLGGGIRNGAGTDVTEGVAAHVSAGCHEAARATRMLGLGDWDSIVVEGVEGNIHVSRQRSEAVLVVARDRSVPSGRLAILAKRAGEVAQRWLQTQLP